MGLCVARCKELLSGRLSDDITKCILSTEFLTHCSH